MIVPVSPRCCCRLVGVGDEVGERRSWRQLHQGQLGRQAHPRPHRPQREATAHAEDLLQRQPAARRAHEGTAGGDDESQSESHQGLVPEQALQRQEARDRHEAAAAAGEGELYYIQALRLKLHIFTKLSDVFKNSDYGLSLILKLSNLLGQSSVLFPSWAMHFTTVIMVEYWSLGLKLCLVPKLSDVFYISA